MRELQQSVLQWKENNQRPELSDISHFSAIFIHYWARWDSLYVRSGVLNCKWESTDGQTLQWQTVLPECLREFVLRELHNKISAGHLGPAKTLERVRSRFYWCGLRKDTYHLCHICDDCAKRKRPGKHPVATKQQYNVGEPFEMVTVDIMGSLPTSYDGNKYMLVISDYFTKWCDAYPIASQDARTVAKVLFHNLVCHDNCIPIVVEQIWKSTLC